MNLPILWTPIAQQSLSDVLEYTYSEFGERQLRKMTRLIMQTAQRLSSFPKLGRLEHYSTINQREYRSIAVIKQIALIYCIVDNCISIEFVKNSRMDEQTILERLNIKLK